MHAKAHEITQLIRRQARTAAQDSSGEHAGRERAALMFALGMADHLEKNNRGFSRELFIKACGFHEISKDAYTLDFPNLLNEDI